MIFLLISIKCSDTEHGALVPVFICGDEFRRKSKIVTNTVIYTA
jgi:hypothetical protein